MNDQSANWNVTSAVNYAGVPLERVRLTPYGDPTFDTVTVNGGERSERPRVATGKASRKQASDPRACPERVSRTRTSGGFDGDVDSSDFDDMSDCYSNGYSSGDCNTVDYDGDRTIDVWDVLDHADLVGAQRQPARRTSANGFSNAHQDLLLDAETLTYYNRRRQYNPWQRRFIQPDPAGFADGVNRYAYARSAPTTRLDPGGNTVLKTRLTDGDPVIFIVNVGFWNHNCDDDPYQAATEHTRFVHTSNELSREPSEGSGRMGVDSGDLQGCREVIFGFPVPRWGEGSEISHTTQGDWADIGFEFHAGASGSSNCLPFGRCQTNTDLSSSDNYQILSHEIGHALGETNHCVDLPFMPAEPGWDDGPGGDPHDIGRHLMESGKDTFGILSMEKDSRRVSEHTLEQVMEVQTEGQWPEGDWDACLLP